MLGFSNMTSKADEFSEDNQIYQFSNKVKLAYNFRGGKNQSLNIFDYSDYKVMFLPFFLNQIIIKGELRAHESGLFYCSN